MILTTRWDTFSKQIDDFVNEGQVILTTEISIKTEAEFEDTKTSIKDWTERCYNFLKSSFDIENNDYAQAFRKARHKHFSAVNQTKDFKQIKKEAFEDFKVKLASLPYFKKVLSISDAIIKPDIVKLSDSVLDPVFLENIRKTV